MGNGLSSLFKRYPGFLGVVELSVSSLSKAKFQKFSEVLEIVEHFRIANGLRELWHLVLIVLLPLCSVHNKVHFSTDCNKTCYKFKLQKYWTGWLFKFLGYTLFMTKHCKTSCNSSVMGMKLKEP